METLPAHIQQSGLALNLTKLEREMILAQKVPIIKNVDDKDLINSLRQIILKAFTDAGQIVKGDDTGINVMALSVLNDIREYFPALTINEVNIAVKNGIRKEYGEYFGINVVSIHNFIRAYKHSEERMEAIRKQKLFEEQNAEPKETISDEEKAAKMNGYCITAFEAYKSGKELIDFGSAKYLHLEKIGLINLTNERKAEIKKLGFDAYQKHKLKEITMKGVIEAMRDQSPEEMIKTEARLIALRQYFDFLIENEIELSEQIDELT